MNEISTAERLERAFTTQPVAPGKIQITAAILNNSPDYERMFVAACAALGDINRCLNLDPDDGGAEPIIDAIHSLTEEITRLKGEAKEQRDVA